MTLSKPTAFAPTIKEIQVRPHQGLRLEALNHPQKQLAQHLVLRRIVTGSEDEVVKTHKMVKDLA